MLKRDNSTVTSFNPFHGKVLTHTFLKSPYFHLYSDNKSSVYVTATTDDRTVVLDFIPSKVQGFKYTVMVYLVDISITKYQQGVSANYSVGCSMNVNSEKIGRRLKEFLVPLIDKPFYPVPDDIFNAGSYVFSKVDKLTWACYPKDGLVIKYQHNGLNLRPTVSHFYISRYVFDTSFKRKNLICAETAPYHVPDDIPTAADVKKIVREYLRATLVSK